MAKVERPLIFNLRSGDYIYLIHIPQTPTRAVFRKFAKKLGKDNAIFYPPRRPVKKVAKELGAFSLEKFARFRLICAPVDYSVFSQLPRRPAWAVVLRHPVQRLIAEYEFAKRSPAHLFHQRIVEEQLDIKQYVEANPRSCNLQTRYLVGQHLRPEEYAQLSEDSQLAIAKVRLDEFAVFGIAEKLNLSLRLFFHSLGWGRVKPIPEEGIVKDILPDIDQETRRYLAQTQKNDMKLYRFALKKFDKRVNRMRGKERSGRGKK